MRLLVYGGNAFEERRRIGEWSEEITPKILQNRAGLSEARPSFGVGISGDAPFLIYRRLHGYGGRSYPLVILLDPGAEIWQLYDWNAAHILLTLFGDSESPGNALLESPERFYSETDLSRLIQKLETKAELPATPIRSIADTETFEKYWFGAMVNDTPIVQVADEETVKIRPTIAEMCQFLEKLEPLMRCAKGWLMGGGQNLVPVFDVHYVIDDQAESMAAQPDPTVNEKLLEDGSRYKQSYADVKEHFSGEMGSEALKDFLKKPFFMWNKTSTKKVFEEFYLLANLHPRTQNHDANISRKTGNYFETNKRILGGDLENANKYVVFGKELKEFSVIFLKNKNIRDDWKEDDGDFDLADFVEYPFDIKADLKAKSRLTLLIKAIGKITTTGTIYKLLVEELDSINSNRDLSLLQARDWQELAKEVISRINQILQTSPSTDKFDPLVWKTTFESPEKERKESYRQFSFRLKDEFNEFARNAESFALPEFHKIYLVFGNDADGTWLLEKQSEEFSKVIDNILQLAFAPTPSEKPLSEAAETWLNKLVTGQDFDKVPQRQRLQVFEKTKFGGWKQLTEIFSGNEIKSKIKSPDDFNKRMLASELPDWKEIGKGANITPQLIHLTELLGEKHYETIFDIFNAVEPPLGGTINEIVVKWLTGWNELARITNKEKSKAKLQAEAIRLISLKPSEDWFDIIKKADIPVDEISRSSELAKVGRDILIDGDEAADDERVKNFRDFFENKYFAGKDVVPKIYYGFMPLSQDDAHENAWRRIANHESLRQLFERELESNESINKNIALYYEKRRRECLGDLQNTAENVAPANFRSSINRLESLYGKNVLAGAAESFFIEYRDVDPNIERYGEIKKILSPYLSDSEQRSFNEKRIFKCLFDQANSDDDERRELENSLRNSETSAMSDIGKSVANFLLNPLSIKGRIFFERYLLKRVNDNETRIDLRSDLASRIFDALEPEAQVGLLTALCENEDIDSLLFGKLLFNEYGAVLQELENSGKRRRVIKVHRNEETIEVNDEAHNGPEFSPLQSAVLRFLASISGESSEKLVNAKENAKKKHQNKPWELDKNLEKLGFFEQPETEATIEGKKKDDDETLTVNGEAATNGGDRKNRISFEAMFRQLDNRTLGNLFIPEFFDYLDRQNKQDKG